MTGHNQGGMKVDGRVFSVIVTHYNQLDYYKTAIDSVLSQNYENIELIFTDDCTQDINRNEIERYINENKQNNLRTYHVLLNEKNMGTIKSLNNALAKASGEFILCFAADDALCNSNVLSNYAREFDNCSKEVLAISFQAYLYDNKLEEYDAKAVDIEKAERINNYTPWQQFMKLTTDCFIPMGSTAFRRECFEKFGKFDEDFKIVEDWSYFLKVTRSGGRFIFINHDGLKHRSGGVSHYEGNDLPPHVITYKNDTLCIFEKEVLPYMNKMPLKRQSAIYDYYNWVRESQEKLIWHDFKRVRRIELVKNHPKLSAYRAILRIRDFALRNNVNYRNGFIVSLLLWGIMCILYILAVNSQMDNVVSVMEKYNNVIGVIFSALIIFTGVAFLCSKGISILHRLRTFNRG